MRVAGVGRRGGVRPGRTLRGLFFWLRHHRIWSCHFVWVRNCGQFALRHELLCLILDLSQGIRYDRNAGNARDHLHLPLGLHHQTTGSCSLPIHAAFVACAADATNCLGVSQALGGTTALAVGYLISKSQTTSTNVPTARWWKQDLVSYRQTSAVCWGINYLCPTGYSSAWSGYCVLPTITAANLCSSLNSCAGWAILDYATEGSSTNALLIPWNALGYCMNSNLWTLWLKT